MNNKKIEISKDPQTVVDILEDGKSLLKEMDYNIKASLLFKANSRLDKDVESVAEKVKHDMYGAFIWCFTFDIHRHDCLKGTKLDYYIVEVIRYIDQQNTNYEIVTTYNLKEWVIREIEDITGKKVVREFGVRDLLMDKIRMQFGALKQLVNHFAVALRNLKSPDFKKLEKSVFIIRTVDDDLTRLKGFDGEFEDREVFIWDQYLINLIKNRDNNTVLKFSVMNFKRSKEIVKHLFYFLKLKKELRLDIGKNLFGNAVLSQSFFQSLYVFVKWEALNYVLKMSSPSCIVVISTFGDPVARMAISAGKKQDIETILYSCRPAISGYRSEDRIIRPDLEHYNSTSFGDSIFVFDKISIDHLIKSGVDRSMIYTYSKYALDHTDQYLLEDGLLILFTGSSYNQYYLEKLAEFKKNNIPIDKVYYRAHPNRGLEAYEIEQLNKINIVCESVSHLKWTELNLKNVVSFIPDSTAAIDAASKGGAVLWIPYFSNDSMMFKPVMDTIGQVCMNEQELFHNVKKYFTNIEYRNELNRKTYGAYRSEIHVEDSSSKFFNAIS